MSKPVLGMLIGLVSGVLIGIAGAQYLEVEGWLSQFCVVASVTMFLQLLGATIASAHGKPHQSD